MRYLSRVECGVAGRGPGLPWPHVDAGQQPVLADHLEVLAQSRGGGHWESQGLSHVHPESRSDAQTSE